MSSTIREALVKLDAFDKRIAFDSLRRPFDPDAPLFIDYAEHVSAYRGQRPGAGGARPLSLGHTGCRGWPASLQCPSRRSGVGQMKVVFRFPPLPQVVRNRPISAPVDG